MPSVDSILQGISTALKAEYPAIASEISLPDGLPGEADFPVFFDGATLHPDTDRGTGNPILNGVFAVTLQTDADAAGYTRLNTLVSDIGSFVHRNRFGLDIRPGIFQSIEYKDVEIEDASVLEATLRWTIPFTLERVPGTFGSPPETPGEGQPGPSYVANFTPPLRGVFIKVRSGGEDVETRTVFP